jgi:predicted nucleic acid-binding Zn finger protein
MSSESVQPDIEPRTIRAATEHMTVIEEADALFSVTTQSGSEYTVDLREPACTCPDFQHRSGVQECKHIRRVRIKVGQVDTDALEARLADTADDLDASATDLQQQAQALAETAEELRDALDRLEEVAR